MATEDTTNIIKYGSRTFGEIKSDLISYIQQSYPEVLSDFTDASIGAVMIDINAGVSNNLSYNTDRAFQETQLEYAQLKASLLNIAKNMGFNIPSKRPSVTIVDITVVVPVLGDAPDPSYLPTLNAGAQFRGGGKIFETLEVVDFSSPISYLGDSNRKYVPNTDSNGIIVSYSVTKREVVINGSTSIFKRVITSSDVTPFFSVTLPDIDVIDIDSVILLEGTNYSSNPSDSEFNDANKRYFEVDYLAQQQIFEKNTNYSGSSDGIIAGKWIDITKKFIKEYTSNGYCKLTFGSGDSTTDAFKNGLLKEGVSNKYFLQNLLSNTALGEKLKSGYTLFIKYRTGGGVNSNVGANVLTALGNYTLNVSGSRQDFNRSVQKSITVTNPIPAIGGNDGLSIEQIRQLIKYNFSGQNRAVTLNDYLVQMYKMPGMYGSPYRARPFKLNNKIVISIINKGSDGKLNNTSNVLLKENIAEYLSGNRMVNDYIEVKDGKIFNLAFDIDVYVENSSDNLIANNIITIVKDYLDVENYEMNSDLFLGKLQKEILSANGVINVISIVAYNKVGGDYSKNAISQEISDTTTGEIKLINNTIYSTNDSMFEVKYPNKDIRVYLRKNAS